MADVELLPLPVRNYVDGDGLWETATGPYSAEETQAYARAVAEHNVKERDAEIEALRAEVERLNRILGRLVEGDGDSTLVIRVGTDAFAAAREYLRPNTK